MDGEEEKEAVSHNNQKALKYVYYNSLKPAAANLSNSC
jgi:hypothetical protein